METLFRLCGAVTAKRQPTTTAVSTVTDALALKVLPTDNRQSLLLRAKERRERMNALLQPLAEVSSTSNTRSARIEECTQFLCMAANLCSEASRSDLGASENPSSRPNYKTSRSYPVYTTPDNIRSIAALYSLRSISRLLRDESTGQVRATGGGNSAKRSCNETGVAMLKAALEASIQGTKAIQGPLGDRPGSFNREQRTQVVLDSIAQVPWQLRSEIWMQALTAAATLSIQDAEKGTAGDEAMGSLEAARDPMSLGYAPWFQSLHLLAESSMASQPTVATGPTWGGAAPRPLSPLGDPTIALLVLQRLLQSVRMGEAIPDHILHTAGTSIISQLQVTAACAGKGQRAFLEDRALRSALFQLFLAARHPTNMMGVTPATIPIFVLELIREGDIPITNIPLAPLTLLCRGCIKLAATTDHSAASQRNTKTAPPPPLQVQLRNTMTALLSIPDGAVIPFPINGDDSRGIEPIQWKPESKAALAVALLREWHLGDVSCDSDTLLQEECNLFSKIWGTLNASSSSYQVGDSWRECHRILLEKWHSFLFSNHDRLSSLLQGPLENVGDAFIRLQEDYLIFAVQASTATSSASNLRSIDSCLSAFSGALKIIRNVSAPSTVTGIVQRLLVECANVATETQILDLDESTRSVLRSQAIELLSTMKDGCQTPEDERNLVHQIRLLIPAASLHALGSQVLVPASPPEAQLLWLRFVGSPDATRSVLNTFVRDENVMLQLHGLLRHLAFGTPASTPMHGVLASGSRPLGQKEKQYVSLAAACAAFSTKQWEIALSTWGSVSTDLKPNVATRVIELCDSTKVTPPWNSLETLLRYLPARETKEALLHSLLKQASADGRWTLGLRLHAIAVDKVPSLAQRKSVRRELESLVANMLHRTSLAERLGRIGHKAAGRQWSAAFELIVKSDSAWDVDPSWGKNSAIAFSKDPIYSIDPANGETLPSTNVTSGKPFSGGLGKALQKHRSTVTLPVPADTEDLIEEHQTRQRRNMELLMQIPSVVHTLTYCYLASKNWCAALQVYQRRGMSIDSVPRTHRRLIVDLLRPRPVQQSTSQVAEAEASNRIQSADSSVFPFQNQNHPVSYVDYTSTPSSSLADSVYSVDAVAMDLFRPEQLAKDIASVHKSQVAQGNATEGGGTLVGRGVGSRMKPSLGSITPQQAIRRVFAEYRAQALWIEAIEFYQRLKDSKTPVDPSTAMSLVTICQGGGQWKLSIQYFSRLSERHRPTAAAYVSVLSACRDGGSWQSAISIVNQARHFLPAHPSRQNPDELFSQEHAVSLAVQAALKAGNWDAALRVAKLCESPSLPKLCENTLTALTEKQLWMETVEYFCSMVERGVRPRSTAVTTALKACEFVKHECQLMVQAVFSFSSGLEDTIVILGDKLVQHVLWVQRRNGSVLHALFSTEGVDPSRADAAVTKGPREP